MLNLPPRFAEIILSFAPMFVQQRTWHHAKLLLLGALLTPGQRTVCGVLRIVGLRRERRFVNYHRVLTVRFGSVGWVRVCFWSDCCGLSCQPVRCCWAWTTPSSAVAASGS